MRTKSISTEIFSKSAKNDENLPFNLRSSELLMCGNFESENFLAVFWRFWAFCLWYFKFYGFWFWYFIPNFNIFEMFSLFLVFSGFSNFILATEFTDAAKAGDLAKVKMMTKENPELVHDLDGVGNTALIIATKKSFVEVVDFLIQSRSDVNYVNKGGFTALFYSALYCSKNMYQIVELLLEGKADVNFDTKSCGTALMESSFGGEIDIVKILIKGKADVNLYSKTGSTAIIRAADNGRVEVVQVLIDAKADVNKINSKDQTALDIAESGGCRRDIVKMLISNGALSAHERAMNRLKADFSKLLSLCSFVSELPQEDDSFIEPILSTIGTAVQISLAANIIRK